MSVDIRVRRTRTVLAIGLMLLAGLAACGRPAADRSDTATSPRPAALEVVRVEERPVDALLSLPGELAAYQSIAVCAKVTGYVRDVPVDRGSRVRQGELLVALEAPELAAQRAEAQSRLQAAEARLAAVRSKADADASTFERLRAAAATPGVVAGNDLVLAQKAAEGGQGDVAAAKENVEAARQAAQSIRQVEDYLRVTAPFGGVIAERNVHVGALVGPGCGTAASPPMLRLLQDERLRLVVPVPEAYAAGIEEKAPVQFTVAAYPGRSFTGSIARVSHDIDVKTRTMAVELDVANGERVLTPGSYCQVRWPVHREGASLFVPAASVASTTDRTFVVRVRNGRAEWVDVRPGVVMGTMTEVFGDLRAGDLVAARGTDEIRQGVEVRVRAPGLLP